MDQKPAPNKKLSFDIIDAATAGYKLSWAERAYLWRLAMIPLAIKIICLTTVVNLGLEGDYIKQALVMLPSYMADGWLLSHIIRLIYLNHRWPFRPTGRPDHDMQTIRDRAGGIMAGTVTYTLIKFLSVGLIAFFTASAMAHEAAGRMEEPAPGTFILALAGLVFLIWAFRFLWLYIPAALNYPIRRFIRDLGGYATSLYMIGTWLLCVVPLFLLFGLVASLFMGIASSGASATVAIFLINILRVFFDTAILIVSTAGIAYGLKMMLGGKK